MNLRNKINWYCCLAISIGLFIVGCTKDKSNLDLQPAENLLLADELNKKPILVGAGAELKIDPPVPATVGAAPENYEFEWTAYLIGAGSNIQPVYSLSKLLNLSYIVREPAFTLGEKYIVRLRVMNKKTNVNSYLSYNVTITNDYGAGWVVLENIAGKGDMSMVFPNNTVRHNVYTLLNTTPLINPKKIEISNVLINDALSVTGKRMYVLAESGSQEINYVTMAKKFDYNVLFFVPPAAAKPQRMTWESANITAIRTGSLGVAIDDGKVYTNFVGGFPGVKRWGERMVNPAGNLNYNVAPFIAGGSSSFPAVVYDNTDKRFYNASSSSLQPFTNPASTVFDMNNVGLTMVFLDSARTVRDFNAIMKDDAGQPYLLSFRTTSTANAPSLTLGKTIMNAPQVLSMTGAAGSTHSPHIYYGVTNKLYSYETTSNSAQVAYTFPVGEEITCIKYQRYLKDGPTLMVGTWDGTKGYLYSFILSANGVVTTPNFTFTGFGKIVDMNYKTL